MLYKREDVSKWFHTQGYSFLGQNFGNKYGVMVDGTVYIDWRTIWSDWDIWCVANNRTLGHSERIHFQSEVVGFIPKEAIL